MKTVSLVRMWTGSYGTFGRLAIDGRSWWTVERSKYDRDHPAIPVGTYDLRLGMFYAGDGPGGKTDYPAYEVMNVPGRTLIKLHVANVAAQVRGCIAPGLAVGFPSTDGIQQLGLMSSGDAFKAFMANMGLQPGTLTIEERF